MAAARSGATPADLARSFSQAVAHHAAGRLDQARSIYERLIRQLPGHPDLLDRYGTLRHQLGDHEVAAELVGRSVARQPGAAAAWNHLGSIRRALGLADRAGTAFRRAALIVPSAPEPWINLAVVAEDRGDREGTIRGGCRALSIQPEAPALRVQVGAALFGLGRFVEARDMLLSVRRTDPLRADLALQLSAVRAALGDHDAALDTARSGIVASPAVHELYPRLIGARDPESDTGAFVAWSRFATRLRPRDAGLWVNDAVEMYRAGRFHEAHRQAQRGCLLNPAERPALQNLVAAAYNLRRYEHGRRLARWCLAAHPGALDVSYALSEIELVIGDLGNAWSLYEARAGRADAVPRVGLPPAWRGPGTEEGALLVVAEQGIGDEVVFLSCLPDLLSAVSVPVVVEVDRRLIPVIGRSFPQVHAVARQYPPDQPRRRILDYRALVAAEGLRHSVYAGSLPGFFRRDRSRPSARGGYLTPDPALAASWRAELERHRPSKTVGLVWRSARMTRFRSNFHAGIMDWAPILEVPGCAFVSLMPGDPGPEIERVRESLGVRIEQPAGLDAWSDIDSLMALMASLDVVVAARTASCAFAGAIGAPTIRVAQSFYRITNDRDLFFANMIPCLDRLAPFEARAGAQVAARLLRERVARP